MSNLANQVQLIGNLGSEPELITFENGNSICKMSLATNESYKDKNGEKVQKTDWHNLVIWGKRGEVAKKFMNKGEKIAISGKLTNRSYETKEGEKRYITEVVVNDFMFLNNKSES